MSKLNIDEQVLQSFSGDKDAEKVLRRDIRMLQNVLSLDIHAATNGFVVRRYNVTTDDFETWVARTSAEFEQILQDWFALQLPKLVDWAKRIEIS